MTSSFSKNIGCLDSNKNYLQDLCDKNNTDFIIRSIDDGDPITLHQRPRGYGGIAVAYNNNLAKHIQPLPDGNTAIQPIILNSVPRGILSIINVYLPCRGNHTEMEFDAALDSLQTIIDKYRPSHDIIVVGDFNASLFEDRCSRDRKFSSWCQKNDLLPAMDYPKTPTHVHHHGSGSSTIDYILCSVATNIRDVSVNVNSVENTSSHHPISARLVCNTTATDHTPACHETPPGHNWKKCDVKLYQDLILDLLPTMDQNDVVCPEAYCSTLMGILTYASSQAMPRPRSKPQSQVWDDNVSRSMAANKQALAEWNEANRPAHGPLWESRKITKRLPDLSSSFDPGPVEPLPESRDRLEMPDFASDFYPGPGKNSPGSGDISEILDFVSDCDPGSGEPWPESGVGLELPDFASDSVLGPESSHWSPKTCFRIVPNFRDWLPRLRMVQRSDNF